MKLLSDGGRRSIIGTPKSILRKFEQELQKDDWHSIRDGLKVKFVTMPATDSEESQGDAAVSSCESSERSFSVAVVSDQRRKNDHPLGQPHRCQRSFPVMEMPLEWTTIHGTKITDLSPLKGMPLTQIYLDFQPQRDTELLRSIRTLENINGKPAAEFWKENDAKD